MIKLYIISLKCDFLFFGLYNNYMKYLYYFFKIAEKVRYNF